MQYIHVPVLLFETLSKDIFVSKTQLKKGATYNLIVENRFPVAGFEGSKHLVLSTS